jgi:hypothetical protein
MQPRAATAPPEPDHDHEEPAPAYLWAVYPAVSRLPLVGRGTAASADDAREEAETVMAQRSEESAFAVILAHDRDHKIGRSTSTGAYRWMPYRFPHRQP